MLEPAAAPRGALIHVYNAGSSSLKVSSFRLERNGALTLLVRAQCDRLRGRPTFRAVDSAGQTVAERAWTEHDDFGPQQALEFVAEWLADACAPCVPLAVGHRVVHGGPSFGSPVLVDEAILEELERLIPLAPLHQPHNLAAIRVLRERQPQLPQVACFDTAFHRHHPQESDLYALPWELYQSGIRRYGFHGLSYEYVVSAMGALDPGLAEGRVIVAHLGSGVSLCALRAGRSIDCTMGFSVLDGVPMGTRPGALDCGVLLYLMQQRGMDAAALERLLYRESGLLGISGVSADMRELLGLAEPRARLAIDHFVCSVARSIGALTAVLGGVDGLVLTGGIGENSAEIRARIVGACGWLGLSLDTSANARGGPRISGPGPVSAWVVPTNEELAIAQHVVTLVGQRRTAEAGG